MVMATGLPQGQRVNPRFTLEVTPGMSITNAIANADALGGDWTILVYPGTYIEGDITPNGGANITLKGMGEGRVIIAPTVAPTIAVIVSAHTLNIEDITVTAPTNAFPAVRVTAGTFRATSCDLNGVLGGAIHDAIQQVGGTITLHDCQVLVGDIDLRDAACTFTAEDCNINGPLDTADGAGANIVMNVTVRHCDCHNQAFNLAATGACLYEFHSNNEMGAITDASLGAAAVNGHICRCHGNGAFIKNGTTGWLIDSTGMLSINNANATGVISVYGGIFLACGNATGVTLWYKTASLMWVLPSGATDEINVQAAIDALPATGGEVFLLEGTYYIESSLVLDSYQTLRGCGRNTILTTTTADLDIIIATGGDGSEKIGIVIADLCVDGSAGGVANDMGILWTYVDYSKIQDIWCQNNGEAAITLSYCDFNKIEGAISQGNGWYGIYLEYSSNNNTIVGNTCIGNYIGIYLEGTPPDLCNDNIVEGNTCMGNTSDGFYLAESNNNTISGNTSIENEHNGIYLDYSSNNNVVVGNTTRGNRRTGILLNDSNRNTVVGNTVQWNDWNGIEFVGNNDNIVEGNTCIGNSQIDDNTYCNILIKDSDYNLIANNLCRAPTIGTTLTVGEPIGETEIAVTDTAGFEVGMGVVIDLGGVNEEYHRISAIAAGAPGVITIDAVLANAQGAGETIDVPETEYGIELRTATCDKNIIKGNDLYDSGKTANLDDDGTCTIVTDDNREIEITQIKHLRHVKQTSGGALVVGDVVSLKAVAAGNEVTTPAAIGEDQVYGMLAENIADNAFGYVQVKGGTVRLKATNVGGGNIVIGDFLCTEAGGTRARKAGPGDQAFARALEACVIADRVIDAYIKSPWD